MTSPEVILKDSAMLRFHARLIDVLRIGISSYDGISQTEYSCISAFQFCAVKVWDSE